eukprot:sb/3470215/
MVTIATTIITITTVSNMSPWCHEDLLQHGAHHHPPDPILEHHHHHQIQRQHHPAPPPPQPVTQPPSKHKIKRAKVEPIVISLPAVVAKEAMIRNSSIRAMLNPALITPDHGNHGGVMEDPEAELARMKLTTAQALKTFKQRFESLSAANLEKRAASAAAAAQAAAAAGSSSASGGRQGTTTTSGGGSGSSGGSKDKDPPYYPPNEHPSHQ